MIPLVIVYFTIIALSLSTVILGFDGTEDDELELLSFKEDEEVELLFLDDEICFDVELEVV